MIIDLWISPSTHDWCWNEGKLHANWSFISGSSKVVKWRTQNQKYSPPPKKKSVHTSKHHNKVWNFCQALGQIYIYSCFLIILRSSDESLPKIAKSLTLVSSNHVLTLFRASFQHIIFSLLKLVRSEKLDN